MTRKEFETRTMVAVSDKEFDAINAVYMTSDLYKDDFCKMWCKMNASRVSRAREEMKRAEREAERKDMAMDIYVTLVYEKNEMNDADDCLSTKQKKFLAENGIDLQGVNIYGLPYYRQIWDVALEVKNSIINA